MPDRRFRPLPDLEERDLEMVPVVVLSALLAALDQIEGLRPLLPEELSAQRLVSQVRDGRNQLFEERFGGRTTPWAGSNHPAVRQKTRTEE